jgi:hypothetical protein
MVDLKDANALQVLQCSRGINSDIVLVPPAEYAVYTNNMSQTQQQHGHYCHIDNVDTARGIIIYNV